MSTNKSANLGLHVWEPEDQFLRTEFNENTEKVDTAAAFWPVQLLDVTTEVAATDVEVDVSHIDFPAFLCLELYILGALAVGGFTQTLYLRCNGLETGYECTGSGSSKTAAYGETRITLGTGSNDPIIWAKFPVGIPSGRAVVTSSFYRASNGNFGQSSYLGAFPVTWGKLKSFQFSLSSANGFPAGTRFILRGIRR